MAGILDIRRKIAEDIFSYQQLTACLEAYKKKRDRITEFLANGEIIKIKKGLYIFAEELRREPLHLPVIANLIYGPSYISSDYALSHYGLIPERVETIGSITTGRTCEFVTPFGRFTYQKRDLKNYPIGINRESAGKTGFLIASPEKALYDKVYSDKSFSSGAKTEIEAFLTDDLRIDLDRIKEFDPAILRQLSNSSRGRMQSFVKFLLEFHK